MTAAASFLIGLFVLLAVLLLARAVGSTTVFEYERGLRFSRGRFAGVLGPGIYRHLAGTTRIQKVDIRPTQVAVTGQEVLSADGVAVKASVAATSRVVDAERAVMGTAHYPAAIYTEVQLALRAVVAGMPVEELLARRVEISGQLKAIAAERLAPIGIELQDAAIRDLTFPGELKKIFGQVVKARQEGLAALEKARGETAALRHLANAAQMIQRNPHLMQLRLLQVLGQQSGNTVVLGMAQPGTMIPIRDSGGPGLPATEDTAGEG
ncbi:MAG TPA: slipin family protein [Gemmatimonadales bacterium]|nr:slipin family protein [Gemmatimonadales bacterium]